MIRKDLRWKDAAALDGRYKTPYNLSFAGPAWGIFDRIFANLAAKEGPPDRVMLDSTQANAHWSAANLRKWGIDLVASAARKVG